jgi:hypothetical protein
MARIERDLNSTINRRRVGDARIPVFLDEIPEGDPSAPDPVISCGLFCMAEEAAQ